MQKASKKEKILYSRMLSIDFYFCSHTFLPSVKVLVGKLPWIFVFYYYITVPELRFLLPLIVYVIIMFSLLWDMVSLKSLFILSFLSEDK